MNTPVFWRNVLYGAALWVAAVGVCALPDYGDPLVGTEPLTSVYDYSYAYVTQLAAYVDQYVAATQPSRTSAWAWNYASSTAYTNSVAAMRARLREMLGVQSTEFVVTGLMWRVVGTGAMHTVESFVFGVSTGASVRGLAMIPRTNEATPAVVLALSPDSTPEDVFGLTTNLPVTAQLGRLLAARGLAVLCPVVMNRATWWSGSTNVVLGGVPLTNIVEHRYWLAQQGFHVGRQYLGIEAGLLTACLRAARSDPRITAGTSGYAGMGREGSVVAAYAAALDTDATAAMLSGGFQERTNVWTLPLDHHQWGVLKYFGDAEIASLIAPHALVVETPSNYPGLSFESSWREYSRGCAHYAALGMSNQTVFVAPAGGAGVAGSSTAVDAFADYLGLTTDMAANDAAVLTGTYSSVVAIKALFHELQDWLQCLAAQAHLARDRYFWQRLATNSLAAYEASVAPLRAALINDMLGAFPPPDVPLRVWTSLYATNATLTTYNVVMTLYTNVNVYGLLNVPRGIAAGERRPCVVCQHGLEGTPPDLSDDRLTNVYHAFALRLAERGFVTYAPQNPVSYWKTFRDIQRRAIALRRDLFGAVLRQHQRQLDFLGALPFVDSNAFGLYGLSYGGYCALWTGAPETRYHAIVCAGKFTDWRRKCVALDHPSSYLYLAYTWTPEHDLWHFDVLNRYSDAELAAMVAPRAFMVETGTDDMVAVPDWSTNEYANVARLYANLGISERTCIDVFDGGHEIHGVASFDFLADMLVPEPLTGIGLMAFILCRRRVCNKRRAARI